MDTYMHGDHESSRLRGGDFGLVHRNGRHQRTDAQAIDQSSNKEHSIGDGACTNGCPDDKSYCRELDRPFPPELVCSVGSDCTADS